jgi:hypothetical protein
VVVWAGETGDLVPAEAEVAAVHRVPLADLDVDPELVTIPESDAPRHPAAAARRLAARAHRGRGAPVLPGRLPRGRHTRVAHLEAPVFAWR